MGMWHGLITPPNLLTPGSQKCFYETLKELDIAQIRTACIVSSTCDNESDTKKCALKICAALKDVQ